MGFISHVKLMRHQKYIFECVKSIGGNCYSWKEDAEPSWSTCFESGAHRASHHWFRFFHPAMVQIDSSWKFSREEMWQSKPFFVCLFVCPWRCNKNMEMEQYVEEWNRLAFPFLCSRHPLFTWSWLRVLLWLISVVASYTQLPFNGFFFWRTSKRLPVCIIEYIDNEAGLHLCIDMQVCSQWLENVC